MAQTSASELGPEMEADRRTFSWYVDKVAEVLMFLGGISAIVFIVGFGIGFVVAAVCGFGIWDMGLNVGILLSVPE